MKFKPVMVDEPPLKSISIWDAPYWDKSNVDVFASVFVLPPYK